MGDCRLLTFLIGPSFVVLALALSIVGTVIWIIGTVLSCLCPCYVCFAEITNLIVGLIKMPVKVMSWCINQIPC